MSSCFALANGPEKAFQWTAPLSGQAKIQTCGAGTTFVSHVSMRLSPCASGSESACDGSTCSNGAGATGGKVIQPFVSSGQTYFIVVDSNAGASGDFSLEVSPPGSCESPLAIASGGGTVTVTSTTSRSQTSGSCGGTGREVVFRWTPTYNGVGFADTCGASTNFNTVLYARGTDCTGTELACNNDFVDPNVVCGNNRSAIAFPVQEGVPVAIVVDGFSGAQGTLQLRVGSTPP